MLEELDPIAIENWCGEVRNIIITENLGVSLSDEALQTATLAMLNDATFRYNVNIDRADFTVTDDLHSAYWDYVNVEISNFLKRYYRIS
ncbi:hypothetical protein PP175_14570 [Aneurinibacillus sp. Ricciae_BoGa-3]|uniref:hypothetical protein n=1 Tax=Aneurinibacillus sp. Ricciae_BoGa-3 TaxID=3022697 RepID=UPI0023426BB7|nr:hypothetical protein [Aneurinibacillus sp. Ricciae_BoGa-3]WCK52655.1 hypothetical protein PP175_14570 [Aneurinibacillus sp. Ricciae_BoGa-3]